MAADTLTQRSPTEPVIWLEWERPATSWTSFLRFETGEPLPLNFGEVELPQYSDVTASNTKIRFMQCWLTFGLVEAFTQKSLPDNALLIGDVPHRTLTISNLPGVLLDLARRLESGELARGPWFEGARSTLRELRTVLEARRSINPANEGEIDLPINLLCFILQVAESLGYALYELVEADSELASKAREFFNWSRFSFPVTQALQKSLTIEGWCPRILTCIDRLSLVSAWVYAAETQSEPELRDHSSCSSRSCVVLDAITNAYGMVHTQADCRCPKIRPNQNAVFEILDGGDIPIFTLSSSGEGGDDLSVLTLKASDTGYWAVSHVWAEGLGSVTEVGLPRCQLLRIKRHTKSHAFWIDSFGVPMETHYRKKAILRMAETYDGAKNVLVIDATLARCSSSLTATSLLFHIWISAWVSRLWTLQESLLASTLMFVLRDNDRYFHDILGPVFKRAIRPPLLKVLCDELSTLLRQLNDTSTEGKPLIRLSTLSRHLSSRSTSKPVDETIATSSLVGISVQPLVDKDLEGRMVHFLISLGRLPRDIIFRRVQRLSTANFTWAPKSLMQPLRLVGPPTTTCTSQGLKGKFQVITFAPRRFGDQQLIHAMLDGVGSERHVVRIGLIREGEIDESGTHVVCDCLILAGGIGAALGSCSATGVKSESNNPAQLDKAGLIRASFRSAGFVVMWGGQIDANAPGKPTFDAKVAARDVHLM